MEHPDTRLLVKVAQLYHLQGLNQDEIARQVGVSRSKVSRMLKEARERGLIEVSIHHPARFSLDLERRLESELGLREAVVVNAGGVAGGHGLSSIAGAASDYLLRVLKPGDVLGVSGGELMTVMAELMPATAVDDITVVQVGTAIAYLGERAAFSAAEVALQMAQKLGNVARLVLIPVPFLLDSETIRDTLLRDSGVRRAMARLASCTVAVVGIGTLDQRKALPVPDEELSDLRQIGAVGEICTRFFDANGCPCTTSLDKRMVALDLSVFRDVPLVIGVAAGLHKAAAILGAVRGGYVKALVTDDATAKELLALTSERVSGGGVWLGRPA